MRVLLRVVVGVGAGGAIVLGGLLWALRPPAPPAPLASSFALVGVTVVNPGQERSVGRSVIVDAGEIQQVTGSDPVPSGVTSFDYSGHTLLPGLIDLHNHLPPANALRLTDYFAWLHLAFGVTSIREVGDMDGTTVRAARDGIERGRFPGPRVFACGPFVAGPAPQRWTNAIVVETPDDAEAAVARLDREGFDCIKAYDDLDLGVLRAVVEAGRRHGLPVLGHVPAALGYEEALLPYPQHFFGVPEPGSLRRDHVVNRAADWQEVDEERLDVIVKTTLEHGLVNTPTLTSAHRLLELETYPAVLDDPAVRLMPRLYRDVIWHPQTGVPVYRDIATETFDRLRDAIAKKKTLVRRLREAGAVLHLGTDTQQPFVVPGIAMHEEMRSFAEAGYTPEEIWTLATRVAAAELRTPDLGTIAAGAPADLLVYRDDPTVDLDHLDSLEAVVADGKLYRRTDLDAALERARKHFDGFVFDRVSVTAGRWLLSRTVQRDF